MSFADAERLVVPQAIVDQTTAELLAAGAEGYEMFVLWSGQNCGAVLEVEQAHIPRQSSYKTESGLLVRVEGDALHALNTWLYREGQALLAQVHAHPTEAFHSSTDDAFPMVTTLGGSGWEPVPLEIVVVGS